MPRSAVGKQYNKQLGFQPHWPVPTNLDDAQLGSGTHDKDVGGFLKTKDVRLRCLKALEPRRVPDQVTVEDPVGVEVMQAVKQLPEGRLAETFGRARWDGWPAALLPVKVQDRPQIVLGIVQHQPKPIVSAAGYALKTTSIPDIAASVR